MTIKEFIDQLDALDCEWELDLDGNISWRGNELCPIWTLHHHEDDRDAIDVHEAGEQLGLSSKSVSQIIAAADNKPGCNKKLRERLLSVTAERLRDANA